MNILMMTNTYKPILGGLEKSVETFTDEFRRRGHRVIIVAPEFEGMEAEEDVIRIPALQNVNGSQFSMEVPVPGLLTKALGDFVPNIVHAHHPFLIGDTALRMASKYNVPLVFTHHTLYEENVHYLPGNEDTLKQFVIKLSTGYANLADQVFAPSESVAELIKSRGVETNVAVMPTGIYINEFTRGAGKAFRRKHAIPSDVFVVGHLGRLAVEKNLGFLSKSVMHFLQKNKDAYFLVVGGGPFEEAMKQLALTHKVSDRVIFAGSLHGKEKVDSYHAMDVFAFASQSETQGLVLTEALAAKVPIVAVDACGVREVVEDKINGRLLMQESLEDFTSALKWIKDLSPEAMIKMKNACRHTAQRFDMDQCAVKVLDLYASLSVRHGFIRRSTEEDGLWAQTVRLIQAQGELVKNLTKAAKALVVL